MFTTELAKELIIDRLNSKGKDNAYWAKEYSKDTFFCETKMIGLLPKPCGERHQTVYNEWGINCNTICISKFRKDDCLVLTDGDDEYIAVNLYLVTGGCSVSDDEQFEEAEQHKGEIYITLGRFYGGDTVEINDRRGLDLSLDELEQRHPDFLKELVFNLK